MSEQKVQLYRLADGETEIELRGLTLHPSDAGSLRALYKAEHFANAVVKRLEQLYKTGDSNAAKKEVELSVEFRSQRDAAFADFLALYLAGKLGAEVIKEKVVSQCTEDDLTAILSYAREGKDSFDRTLRNLVNQDPVGLLESLVGLLMQGEAGKTYLKELSERLQTALSQDTKPTEIATPAS